MHHWLLGVPCSTAARCALQLMLVFAMAAQVRLRVWRRDASGARLQELLCDLSSKHGAVEVGGGPWWSTWSAQVILNRHSDSAYT